MSNELPVIQNTNLPDTINDLSKFILIGREKLNAVRAEIRAIEILKLAENVHNQKLEEASLLAEAVLDAEVRMGELLQKIPKKQGKRTDLELPRTDTEKSKTKTEIVEELGLSDDQAQHFEIMANNQDIVEYVKGEARENGDIPTKKRVLDLAVKKKKGDDDYDEYLNLHVKICKELDKIVETINKFEITDYRMDAIVETFDGVTKVNDTVKYIEGARDRLALIITELRKAEKRAKKV